MHGVIDTLTKPVQVLVGTVEAAIAYAEAKNLAMADYRIAVNARQLHEMDPPSITRIVLCDIDELGAEMREAVLDEIVTMRRLWGEIIVHGAV